MKTLRRILLPLVGTLMLSASLVMSQTEITVIATTSILADVAQNVSGGLLNVESLLPFDADTHAYEPSVDDAARVAEADLLLVVGMDYEHFLGGLLETVGEDVPVAMISNGIEILPYGEHDHEGEEAEHEHEQAEPLGVLGDGLTCEDDHEHEAEATAEAEHEGEHDHGTCDPHVWMNPLNMMMWASNIAEAFAALDPAHADTYRDNALDYAAQIEALNLELSQMVAEIPEEQRVLITNHEFMAYFAAHYGFEIAATVLPGGTTGAEINPQELADVIALVQAEGVPAIFAEVSANPELAQLIASESGAAVVSTLYSESLSASAPTYLDFMRLNTRTIVDALR